jgi:hypothetical protein
VRWLLFVRTDFLAACSESVGELGYTSLQSLDPVGEEANHLVEIADRLILERNSALELRDSLFHRRIVLAHSGPLPKRCHPEKGLSRGDRSRGHTIMLFE